MARSPFCISKRTVKDKETGKNATQYRARFFDEDGRVVKTRALLATSPVRAALEAQGLLEKGGGVDAADPLAMDFLADFWRIDSTYARMKALRGHPLSTEYLAITACIIRKHLSEHLKGIRLSQLTVPRLERFILSASERGLSPKTINACIMGVKTPVADYSRKHRIPDPLQYLRRIAERPKARGILSVAEIAKIVALESENPRVRCAVLLGALCGLRLGECRGLQWADVDAPAGLLHVRGNYVTAAEGLKCPKCGSTRDVPLPAVVLEAVALCRAVAPKDARFVLWNDRDASVPIAKNTVERGFRAILRRIEIDEETRKERNLVFHGLRHSFVSMARTQGLPDFVTMRLAGHKSASMMERYSHADANSVDFAAARRAFDAALERAK